ncbi:hypothetical protein Acsp03_44950 [Actinomadura sp. NBRC 104412]|nr:hypothetical protein Acsp03_44950 [Actinomadura sp. NBRC 104412]
MARTDFPAVTRDLLASDASAGLAQDAMTGFLRLVGLDRHAESGRSIITELMSNAIKAGRRHRVRRAPRPASVLRGQGRSAAPLTV